MTAKKKLFIKIFILTLLATSTLACISIWLTSYIASWGGKWSWLFNCLIPILTLACGAFGYISTKKIALPSTLLGLTVFITSFAVSLIAYFKREPDYVNGVLLYIVFILFCVISLIFSLNLTWIFAKGGLLFYALDTILNNSDEKPIRKIRLLLWLSPIAVVVEIVIILLQILLSGFVLAFFDYILAFVASILYWEIAFLFGFVFACCFIYGVISYKTNGRKIFFAMFIVLFSLISNTLIATNAMWFFITLAASLAVNFSLGFLGTRFAKKYEIDMITDT